MIFHLFFEASQLQLFRRMLQCCFAVKLERCLVDDKTLHDFPSAWLCGDNDLTDNLVNW